MRRDPRAGKASRASAEKQLSQTDFKATLAHCKRSGNVAPLGAR